MRIRYCYYLFNLTGGNYAQSYYTEQAGVKVNNAVAPVKTLPTNPALKHYFYVVPEESDLTTLADQLFGTEDSVQKGLFSQINLNAYGVSLPAGTWAYLPMKGQQYQVGDILAVNNALQQVQNSQSHLDETSRSLYAQGVGILGYSYFALEQVAEASSTGLELIDKNFEAIKSTVEDLASLGEQAQQAAMTGTAASMAAVKNEITAKTQELTEKIQTFLDKVGVPKDLETIKSDTTVEWQIMLSGVSHFNKLR